MAAGKYHYHIRSTSLPSTSHPLTTMVEEQLNNLKEWEQVSSHINTTSSSTLGMLLEGFNGLRGLYESVEDLLQLPNTRQILMNHRHEKWVDETLDGSLKLLDASGRIRDVLLQTKEKVQAIRSALRRRKGGDKFDLCHEIGMYMALRKKSSKEIRVCLGELKRVKNRNGSSSSTSTSNNKNKNPDLVAVMTVISRVETITVSLCEHLLMFISAGKPKSWSLVSRLLEGKRLMQVDVEGEMISEVKMVDVCLNALASTNCHKSSSSSSCHGNQVAVAVQNAQKRLDGLEASIGGLEEGLEWVFRQLIKTRVSLLNILNN